MPLQNKMGGEKNEPQMPNPEVMPESAAPEKIKEDFEAPVESKIDGQLRETKPGLESAPPATSKEKISLTEEERKEKREKLINSYVNAARLNNFSDKRVERIMKIAKKYVEKNHPNIADEIHDRIIQERNEQSGGMY